MNGRFLFAALLLACGTAAPAPVIELSGPTDPLDGTSEALRALVQEASDHEENGRPEEAVQAFQRCAAQANERPDGWRAEAYCRYHASLVAPQPPSSPMGNCVAMVETELAESPTLGFAPGETTAPLLPEDRLRVLLAVRAEYERRGFEVLTETEQQRLLVPDRSCSAPLSPMARLRAAAQAQPIIVDFRCGERDDCVLEVRGSTVNVPTLRSMVRRSRAATPRAWLRAAAQLAPMELSDDPEVSPLDSVNELTLSKLIAFGFSEPPSRVALRELLVQIERCPFWGQRQPTETSTVALSIDRDGSASVISAERGLENCSAAALQRTRFQSARSNRQLVLELTSYQSGSVMVCNQTSTDQALMLHAWAAPDLSNALSSCVPADDRGHLAIDVTFRVEEDGTASDIEAAGEHLPQPIRACVMRSLQAARWPCPLRGPASVTQQIWISRD